MDRPHTLCCARKARVRRLAVHAAESRVRTSLKLETDEAVGGSQAIRVKRVARQVRLC